MTTNSNIINLRCHHLAFTRSIKAAISILFALARICKSFNDTVSKHASKLTTDCQKYTRCPPTLPTVKIFKIRPLPTPCLSPLIPINQIQSSQSQHLSLNSSPISPNTAVNKMGFNLDASDATSKSHYNTHKLFLFTNYVLLGSASSCIFLTLSLRLVPSLPGFFLILLHIFTILTAISGLTATLSNSSNKWYAAHMIATVLTAIFQGSVSVLIFSRTDSFLAGLQSYVREDDAAVILKLAGGLCILIFCLEWVVLVLAFVLKYYSYVERENCVTLGSASAMRKSSAKVGQDQDLKDWPWPFQV